MSALLRAELLRLASRRLLVMMLVAMAGLAAMAAMVNAESVRPLTEQGIATVRESVRVDTIAWQEACGGDAVSEECEFWTEPRLVDYLAQPVGFGEYAAGVLNFGFPLVLIAVASMVASLVGAEFASGNLGTQLLFTPRRIPLMFAKLAASCVAGIAVSATFVVTALVLSAITFLSLRGAHDMSAGVDLPLLIGRIMLLALLLAVMSGALTMGLGSTLITMGVFAVVLVGSWTMENVVRVSSLVHVFLPSRILQAMMAGQTEIYDWQNENYELRVVRVINYDWALGYSVIGAAIIVVTAAWWFRRRDILH